MNTSAHSNALKSTSQPYICSCTFFSACLPGKVQVIVTAAMAAPVVSEPPWTPQIHHSGGQEGTLSFQWTIVAGMLAGLMLLALVISVVFSLRHAATKQT